MVAHMLSLLRRLESRAARKMQAGVDVSSFQGPPATWRAEAGHISWAAVKLTELEPDGTRYVNPDAAADWRFLGQGGRGRLAYLFGHPSVSAADTVSFFVGELTKLGLKRTDGVVLDLEVTDGRTPAEVDSWAATVLADLVHRLERRPVVYTFLSFAREGNCNRLGRYPLWIADPSSPAGRPSVPKPWSTWTIHQYDITGPIDRDVANFTSLAAMTDALGKPKPKEPALHDLGGSIVADITSVRWDDGVTVIAGLGKDGFVQAARWESGKWGAWKNVSLAKAHGAPGLVAWGAGHGHLYYTDATSGHVIELDTSNFGQTWA
jgi:GH25 family lysozyme M1 (1,4-beta-N-acetylmuramidase)